MNINFTYEIANEKIAKAFKIRSREFSKNLIHKRSFFRGGGGKGDEA